MASQTLQNTWCNTGAVADPEKGKGGAKVSSVKREQLNPGAKRGKFGVTPTSRGGIRNFEFQWSTCMTKLWQLYEGQTQHKYTYSHLVIIIWRCACGKITRIILLYYHLACCMTKRKCMLDTHALSQVHTETVRTCSVGGTVHETCILD